MLARAFEEPFKEVFELNSLLIFFKAMVELTFVKVKTVTERKKKMNNGGFPRQSVKYAPIQKLFLLLYHQIRTFDFAPTETGYE